MYMMMEPRLQKVSTHSKGQGKLHLLSRRGHLTPLFEETRGKSERISKPLQVGPYFEDLDRKRNVQDTLSR